MRLYLVRHGKASHDQEKFKTDEARALTKRGRSDVARIAAQLAKAETTVYQIRHSGLVRARETAEIFAEHLNPPGGLIQIAGLLWDDPVEQVGSQLHLETESVMLVGHNPYMERMTGYLLTGNADNTPLIFKTSGTACLEYADAVWSLCWALNPEILPGEG